MLRGLGGSPTRPDFFLRRWGIPCGDFTKLEQETPETHPDVFTADAEKWEKFFDR